jgi:hypothetical protein
VFVFVLLGVSYQVLLRAFQLLSSKKVCLERLIAQELFA